MASSAISAQGTKFYIAGSAGAAKTVSAITAGTITKIVFTAPHGWSAGDVVTFDSNFAGADAATLNGKTITVKALEGTTGIYFDTISTSGKTITAGTATGTAASWTQVKNLTSLKGLDGSAKEIDITNHDSTAVEMELGLPDNGNLSLEFDGDNSDAGQVAMQAARDAVTIKTFKYVLPTGTLATCTFSGFVKKFDMSAPINDKFKRMADVRISGPVAFS